MPRNRKSSNNHQSRKDRSAQDDDTNMCDIRDSVDPRGVPPEMCTSSPFNSRCGHTRRSFSTQPSQRSQHTRHHYRSAQTFEPAFRLNNRHPNNHHYAQVIRDIFCQGTILQQKMKRVLDGLECLLPGEEDMEWECVGTTVYVPWPLAWDVGGGPGMEPGSGTATAGESLSEANEARQNGARDFSTRLPGQGRFTSTLGNAADNRLDTLMDST